MYMYMYHSPAKFKSANIFAMQIWDPTAKFNSYQYFRLHMYIMYMFVADTLCVDHHKTQKELQKEEFFQMTKTEKTMF